MKTTHFEDDRECPHCHAKNDGASSVFGEATPALGDISICAYCTEVSAFAENGLRKLTPEESHGIAGDPQIRIARETLAEFNRRRPN